MQGRMYSVLRVRNATCEKNCDSTVIHSDLGSNQRELSRVLSSGLNWTDTSEWMKSGQP